MEYKPTIVRCIFFIISRPFTNIARPPKKKKNIALYTRKLGLPIAIINIPIKAFTYVLIYKALKYLIKGSI